MPNGTCRGRILSGFVIDLGKARKRLRARELGEALVPPVTRALALADEFQAALEAESVNQSQLARRYGLSRQRVSQLLNLHRPHPRIQEFLRALQDVGPR